MTLTLREAAVILARLAEAAREVAGRVDGTETARWAIARDLRATSFRIDSIAVQAEQAGKYSGEAESPISAEDLAALPHMAPGEIVELFGS